MKKKICFFSVGFAFNRLVRLKYYEKILPKDVEIFLYTTNKYSGKEKESYQHKWDLKRTKIHMANYNPLKLALDLKSFCDSNKIERLINLGNRGSLPLFLPSTIFSERDYLFNMMGNVPNVKNPFVDGFSKTKELIFFYIFGKLSRKIISNDYEIYKRFENKRRSEISKFFIKPNKIKYLPATIDTTLFRPINKKNLRKKLNLPEKKPIIIFVGRVVKGKGSDIVLDLIKKNKNIHFLVIGRLMDKQFLAEKDKLKNLTFMEKKSSSELVEYYNVADLGIFPTRQIASGLGLTAAECLACGTPVLVPVKEVIEPSPSIIHSKINKDSVAKSVRDYFRLPQNKRLEISKLARTQAEKNYSQSSWKESYIRDYLS